MWKMLGMKAFWDSQWRIPRRRNISKSETQIAHHLKSNFPYAKFLELIISPQKIENVETPEIILLWI